MGKILLTILVILFLNATQEACKAEDLIKEKIFKVTDKGTFNMVTDNKAIVVTPNPDGTIMISVKNEFDEEIKVKLDTNREYPIKANEWISLGDRKPGKYTLSVYNKNGDFVDNLSLDITKKNKFSLNKDTVSDSGKITGLSTGKKVAITAGAVGAAAIGAAILGKALMSGETNQQAQYIPPVAQAPIQAIQQQIIPSQPIPQPTVKIDPNNAFASGGKPIKVLNTSYEKVTFIVEGVDGTPIGNNWIIPKATFLAKSQPITYSGQNILITSKQKIKVVLPDGNELIRSAFELEKDSFDGSYIWIIK